MRNDAVLHLLRCKSMKGAAPAGNGNGAPSLSVANKVTRGKALHRNGPEPHGSKQRPSAWEAIGEFLDSDKFSIGCGIRVPA